MISIVLCTMRPAFKENIYNNFFRQSFEDKEMIIVLNNNELCINEWENETKEYDNIHVYEIPEETTLGECLNFAISKSSYDIIAKFDDDDYYSSQYLTEAYDALVENDVDIVGKNTSYIYFDEYQKLMVFRPGNENTLKKTLKGGTLVFKKKVWQKIKFQNRAVSSDSYFLKDANKNGYKIYSTSKGNYLCVRRKDVKSHTQKLQSKKYMRKCILVAETTDPIQIVDLNKEVAFQRNSRLRKRKR